MVKIIALGDIVKNISWEEQKKMLLKRIGDLEESCNIVLITSGADPLDEVNVIGHASSVAEISFAGSLLSKIRDSNPEFSLFLNPVIEDVLILLETITNKDSAPIDDALERLLGSFIDALGDLENDSCEARRTAPADKKTIN